MVTTRKNNYEHESSEASSSAHGDDALPTPSPPTWPGESLAEKRLRWSALLHALQYHTVISQVLAEEMPKYSRSSVVSSSLSTAMRECVLILASAPLIFTAAVDGVLASQILTSEELRREYTQIQDRANVQPSIYIHLLADSNGIAPSANQYMLIRNTVLRYINSQQPDTELAHLIDNIHPPTVPISATLQEYRKHLWTHHLSPQRTATLHRFSTGILSRSLSTPTPERDIPFRHPPGECGYALNSHTRLHQHRHRNSSNYVMNLVEDICAHLYATKILPERFFMHQFIIYLIFKPEQVRIAEIFCSGLLQVWVDNGGGFNHWPAGLSCASGDRVTREEWEEHERWVREGSWLEENLGKLRERMEDVVKDLGDEEGVVWRRALESGREGAMEVVDAKDVGYESEDDDLVVDEAE